MEAPKGQRERDSVLGTVSVCVLCSSVDFRFPVQSEGGNQSVACQKAKVLTQSLLDTAKQG